MRRHSRRDKSPSRYFFAASGLLLALGCIALWPRGEKNAAPATLVAQADEEPLARHAAHEATGRDEPVAQKSAPAFKPGWAAKQDAENPPVQPTAPVVSIDVKAPAPVLAEIEPDPAPDAQTSSESESRTPPTSAPRAADPPVVASAPAIDFSDSVKNATPPAADATSLRARIESAVRRFRDGQRVAPRHELNALLATTTNPLDSDELRRHLSDFAEETVFSNMRVPGDPMCVDYAMKSGDLLMNIARDFDVPHELVLAVNGISDAKRIRAGQTLKIPRGPFHVKVDKSDFRLDLYLQDLYVRSFKVGLGAQAGTPDGEWIVKDRVRRPTYYPPPSSAQRGPIKPSDPRNPLGEYWIGLKGTNGNAVGQESFGIHGTNEPESIGTNSSLGCVRMHNTDVEYVFRLLVPGKSKVTIVP